MKSARAWIDSEVRQRALQSGVDATGWHNSSWMTSLTMGAMTSDLAFDNPANEAERRANRRVAIAFKEYPLPATDAGAVTFDEQAEDELVFA